MEYKKCIDCGRYYVFDHWQDEAPEGEYDTLMVTCNMCMKEKI